jgi:hypothetical protein
MNKLNNEFKLIIDESFLSSPDPILNSNTERIAKSIFQTAISDQIHENNPHYDHVEMNKQTLSNEIMILSVIPCLDELLNSTAKVAGLLKELNDTIERNKDISLNKRQSQDWSEVVVEIRMLYFEHINGWSEFNNLKNDLERQLEIIDYLKEAHNIFNALFSGLSVLPQRYYSKIKKLILSNDLSLKGFFTEIEKQIEEDSRLEGVDDSTN